MVTYLEAIEDKSPNRASFRSDGGKASATYYVDPDELEDAITDILGSVEPDGAGALTRVLPKAHPQFPWLYATSITSIQGLGQRDPDTGNVAVAVAAEELEADTLTDEWQKYPLYAVTVEFEPRPYAVLSDDWVIVDTVTGYDDDGTPLSAVTSSGEWVRFTDYEIEANPELLTAQQGQAYFATSGADISTTGTAPHGFPFSGFPQIYIEKSTIKFRWYMVPWSFVTSPDSYIRRYIGRVNQKDWYNWDAGRLLYVGFTAKRYVPPVPAREPAFGTFSLEKNCDIEFVFHEVNRTQSSVPTPVNGSWIAAGHNLVPWFGDRSFYYTVYPKQGDVNNENYWHPLYQSCIFDQLFTDPDV